MTSMAASAKGRGKSPILPRAAPPTRPPRRRAWHAARWKKLRPSSTPPRPSQQRFGKLLDAMDRTGRANWCPTGNLGIIEQAQATSRLSRRHCRAMACDRAGIIDIPWAYEPDDENAPERCVLPYTRRARSSRPVRSTWARSCTRTPSSECGSTNYILSRGDHAMVLAASRSSRCPSSRGPKITSVEAIGR